MSVLILFITIVGLALIIWMVRKVLDLSKIRKANGEENAESGSPNSTGSSNPGSNSNPGSTTGQAQSSSSQAGNPELSNYKNPEGRRVLNAMLFMAQQYSSRNRSSSGSTRTHHRKPSPPQTMRRASLHNGTVRVKSTGSPHRVVPSRVSYHRRQHQPGSHGSGSSLHPPLVIGENTVQIEVPIVVVLPPGGASTSRAPVTIVYDDPPPPFDEEPPPPYDEIFGPHYKHITK